MAEKQFNEFIKKSQVKSVECPVNKGVQIMPTADIHHPGSFASETIL
jgi:hypothetical protein